MRKRTLSFGALAVAILLVTAACSNDAATTAGDAAPVDESATEEVPTVVPSSGADRVVEVELSEFDITADSFEFAPGETIEFIVTNSGVAEHELRLSNEDRVVEHLAAAHADEDHDASGEEAEEAEDAFVIVEAGATETLIFTFPDNDHDYTAAVCLIPGHYEAGMATDLSYQT